ncbi:MAG: amidohydrolase family protein [Alphaproteobacteria bacterium]|nr:amidohydrolase family protein [Alphaproteobacteria bacterium]MBV9372441.1 amidohydrolase family protein [Alphaproteobacteria bacterium]MBV9902116.1 amidohydrolase family protein [Alphaproteobacteria bacterium]
MPRRLLPLPLLLLLLLLLAGSPPAAATPPAATTVYRHAALIDGTGAPVRRDMAVIVRGERIVAVLPDRGLTRRHLSGAAVVTLAGRYLLPGLIDSHKHIATPPDRPRALAVLRRDLYGGVTAMRDMADDLREVTVLARAARQSEIAAPDIYYAALVAGPSFFGDPRTRAAAQGLEPGQAPWMQAVAPGSDIAAIVARAKGTGATALKIYANLDGATVAALTREAHRQGLRVWAHGMVFPATPAQVAAAGPDVMSHVCYLAYQAMDRRPDSYQNRFPVDARLFAEGDNAAMARLFATMRRRGIILDATDYVYPAAERAERRAGKTPRCTLDLALKLTRQAWRSGVALSAGTDAEAPRESPWPALFEEMALLGRSGMTPLQVIQAATLTGAETIGQAREMGSIRPGKLANLVVLARNPLDSLANLRSVVMIVKRGRPYPRGDFRPIGKEEMEDD